VSDLRVVALLGVGVVPADTPILRADDLGALRGDGIFETMDVRGGQAWLLDEHLARMERSAALMELPLPALSTVIELAEQALAAWPADREGALRLVCTRGSEIAPGPATLFATVNPVPPSALLARAEGVAVRTASLGVPADLRASSPWLLGGAKTLSYAVNMASQRWAQSAGVDDVLWVSGDGFAMEAPTSTLVWLESDALLTVPPLQTGILAGTTARWLLDHCGDLGLTADERMVRPEELAAVNGVWFTSSVRGLVAIRSLDGTPMPYDPAMTAKLQGFLGFA
jgi:4-amino-4-deoxychorismate lyase